jgi:hypothetical protein
MKPKLKAHGSKRLKLRFGMFLSNFAFEFNLRRYTKVAVCSTSNEKAVKVGQCRSTL